MGRQNDNPAAPSEPPAVGSAVRYAAVGASDVIGFGSSSVCLPFVDCNGNGYVFAGARQLRSEGFSVVLTPLGIPGAVISNRVRELGRQYGRGDILASLIDNEAPFVPRDATVVTIFTGPNDLNVTMSAVEAGAGGSDPDAYIDNQVRAFGADYGMLLASIRSRAQSARIVVLNVPNVGVLPYLSGATAAQKRRAQRASVGMTTTIINGLQNVTVIDLMCDGRLYQPSNLASDGFHPNDAGYSVLGVEVARAIASSTYPAPSASCGLMTLVP